MKTVEWRFVCSVIFLIIAKKFFDLRHSLNSTFSECTPLKSHFFLFNREANEKKNVEKYAR